MNKNFDYGKTYYKVMNSKENHYGLQYDDGLIIDHRPFGKMYYDNGIHFSTIENILAHTYIEDARYIREIIVPEDAEVIKQSVIKYKANKVILGQRFDLDDEEDMNYLLSIGMDIHVLSESALINVCKEGSINKIKYLVKKGANIHIEKEKPLIISCIKGCLDIVKYLVEQGADIHVDNNNPLRVACIYGHLDIVKYLTDEKELYINTYKHFFHAACTYGHLDIVKYLVEKGLYTFINNDTVLNLYQNNYFDILKYLINIKKCDYNDIIYKSCGDGNLDMVKYLVEEQGLDIHMENERILYIACCNNNLDIVKYLVKHGAKIYKKRKPIICDVCKSNNLDVLKYLVEERKYSIHMGNDLPLRNACKYGYYNLDVVKYLVEHGADIHVNNEEPLHNACYKNDLDIVKYLVENGADIHVNNEEVLHNACRYTHLDIVKYLIEQGADIEALRSRNYKYSSIIKRYL